MDKKIKINIINNSSSIISSRKTKTQVNNHHMPEFKSKYLSSFIWGVNWDDGIFFGKKKKLTKMIVLKKAIFERIMWMKKKNKEL